MPQTKWLVFYGLLLGIKLVFADELSSKVSDDSEKNIRVTNKHAGRRDAIRIYLELIKNR